MDVARTGAFSDGTASTAAVSVFDTVDVGPAPAAHRRHARRALRRERSWPATPPASRRPTSTTDDTLLSGKVGALYKLTDQGNVYFAWGNTKTPPGTANFTLSAQPNNQNNPNVDPQISTNVEVGSKWDFYGSRLSLTGAAFRTKNENVIFTVDATAVPPVFNQDDAQRVTGASLGVAGRIIRELRRHRELRLSRLREPVAEPASTPASA